MVQLAPTNTFAIVLLICAAVLHAEAFSASTTTTRTSFALQASNNGRRGFLDAAMSTTAGLVMASIPAMAGAEETASATDDLAMPSEEDTTKADVSRTATITNKIIKYGYRLSIRYHRRFVFLRPLDFLFLFP